MVIAVAFLRAFYDRMQVARKQIPLHLVFFLRRLAVFAVGILADALIFSERWEVCVRLESSANEYFS